MRKPELPKLPDGYFWRVTSLGLTGTTPHLELRKKTFWGFSKQEAARFSLSHFESAAEEVEFLASEILEKQSQDRSRQLEVQSLEGDYGVTE